MEQPQLTAAFYRNFFTEELYLIQEPEQVPSEKAASAAPAEVLVPAQPKELPTEKKEALFAVSGGNKKGVAVVFNMMPADFSQISSNQLLLKILASIQLTADDVLFVNLNGPVEGLPQLYEQLPIEQSILFLAANHPLVLKHKLKPFQPMSAGGKYVIAGGELSGLQSSNEKKKQLWTGLQAMFL